MKLTIEIDQPNPNTPPVVTVAVDGEPIGLIQSMELLAKSDRTFPKLLLKFPALGAVLSADGNIETIKAKVASIKKTLSKASWIEVT